MAIQEQEFLRFEFMYNSSSRWVVTFPVSYTHLDVYKRQIWILDICGFISGAGQGFLMPLLGALILENYEGAERERMLGLNTTFITGGSALFLLLAGPVCEMGWVNVYFLYFAAIPVMIIAQLFLVKDEKPHKQSGAGGKRQVSILSLIHI